MTKKGQTTPRILTRARVLLLANDGIEDTEIMIRLEVCKATCVNLRRRFQTERLNILHEKARPGRPTIFDGATREKITALACSETPDGHASWSYQLLADKAVELGFVEFIRTQSVRFPKNALQPHRIRSWCLGKLDAGFFARMEDILHLYSLPYNPLRPLVVFDERPCPLAIPPVRCMFGIKTGASYGQEAYLTPKWRF